MYSYNKEIFKAKDLILKSGKYLIENFNKRHNVKIKADNTELLGEDMESERILLEGISKSYPSDSIFTEEADTEIKSERVWVFDPICGSYSYLRGIDTWSVSVALVVDGTFKIGVVYQPLLNNLYWGEIGRGAWMNNNIKIHTSNVNDLSNAFISVEHAVFYSNKLKIIDFIKHIKRIRVGHGSGGELAYTAAGKLDAVIKTNQTLTHFAGGRAVLEAAGGVFYTFNGVSAPTFFDKSKNIDYIAASNQELFDRIIEYKV